MDAAVADKLLPLILDALTRAAADPAGAPLYTSKTESGLFPGTTVGKQAAARACAEGWLAVIPDSPASRPRAQLTTAGQDHLLAVSNPKQVLEDFVRILEQRESEVRDLVAGTDRLSATLTGLSTLVTRLIPRVEAARVPVGAVPAMAESPVRTSRGEATMTAVALLDPPLTARGDDLAEAILARLTDWCSSAGVAQDCPLPELYRSLSTRDEGLTIGQFHDCLRDLRSKGRVELHPWTGPLYALPEPAYALMAGHNVAYYASVR